MDWNVCTVNSFYFVYFTKWVFFNNHTNLRQLYLFFCMQTYRIRSNSRPCPYKRPPIIFWSYIPQNNQPSTRSIHKAYILSSIWLGFRLKMAKITACIFGSILATNIEKNKCPPKMIYLSALGAYWNEYGTLCWFNPFQWDHVPSHKAAAILKNLLIHVYPKI